MQFTSTTKLMFISLLLLGVGGCGGSGNSEPASSPSPSSAATSTSSSSAALPASQNFAFAQVGPLMLVAGDILTNQAIGTGSGLVTYMSSNTAVATVSGNGLVTVVGAGDAVITASKAADSQFLAATASYTIHASSVQQTFSFAQTGFINLLAGATLANPAAGQGSGTITYLSSNPNVATVDSNGLVTVTVVGAGSTIITATKAADPHYYAASASYSINATGAAQTISFAQPGPFSVLQNASFTNQATGQGSAPVIYKSNNTSVAMVNSLGQVSVIGAGSATITATKAADSRYLSATSSYTVNSQAINLAVTGELYEKVGNNLTNYATSQGSGALTFSSSNTGVASVDNDGIVTLVGEGSAVITVSKAADANYLAISTSYVVNAVRTSQVVNFNQSGSINLSPGETLANPATAQGTGALTYSSSDTAVATVDSSGLVTVTGGGSVIITATVAADTKYSGATASYTINANVPVTAWVGSNDTLIDFPATTRGEFYRSSSSACDFANYLSCADGQMSLLNGTTILDSAARLDRPGYYVLKNGTQQTALTLKVDVTNPANNIYPRLSVGRSEPVVFNNKIWVMGKQLINNQGGYYNDIWSSADGLTWIQEVAAAPFQDGAATMFAYNNKLWVIKFQKEVWSSVDGVNWFKETSNPQYPLWIANTFIAYKDKIWLIGGMSDLTQQPTNEIWSSTNGKQWTLEANAAFPARVGGGVIVFNNQLWVIGGSSMNGTWFNDVWSSNDGITWVQQTANAAFSTRGYQGVTSHKDKLWLVGGYSPTNVIINGVVTSTSELKSDVWSSTDGIVWTQETAKTPFSRRNGNLINFQNHLMLLSGYSYDLGFDLTDTWISADGAEWRVGYKATLEVSD